MISKDKTGLIHSILGAFDIYKQFSGVGLNFPDDRNIYNFKTSSYSDICFNVSNWSLQTKNKSAPVPKVKQGIYSGLHGNSQRKIGHIAPLQN